MLLLLLFLAITDADIQPLTCTAPEANGQNQHTQCIGRGNVSLHDVPKTTHSLELLDVHTSHLEHISNASQHLQLHSLKITESTVPEFNISLTNYQNLTTLKISNTSLKIFSNVTANKLEILDVSHNQLQNFTNNTFLNLKVLNLSYNSITNLSKYVSNNFNELKSLDLSENHLKVLDADVFRNVTKLTHLNLSYNLFVELNEAWFRPLLSLQQLDLSWNKIEKIGPGSLQLPSLVRLNLMGNVKLGEENALLFEATWRLQIVDVTMTGLNRIPLSLTQSIRTLRLNKNNINLIKSGDVDSYPYLHLLDISENNLSSIEYDALGRSEMLTIIYLADNALRTIPKSLPWRLKVLHLERNRITSVNEGDLDDLKQLEILNLRSNRIATIESKAFNSLKSLSYLDLSENPIKSFSGSLTGPWELHVLKLSNIDILETDLNGLFPLANPEHLITVDLSGSKGLIKTFLDDTATLAACKELQEINLSNGGLVDIRRTFLDYFPQLRRLLIDDNNFDCDKIRWLVGWLLRQNQEDYQNVVCGSPSEMWGFRLIDLQTGENYEDYTAYTTSTTTVATTTVRNDLINKIMPNITAKAKINELNSTVLEKNINVTTVRIETTTDMKNSIDTQSNVVLSKVEKTLVKIVEKNENKFNLNVNLNRLSKEYVRMKSTKSPKKMLKSQIETSTINAASTTTPSYETTLEINKSTVYEKILPIKKTRKQEEISTVTESAVSFTTNKPVSTLNDSNEDAAVASKVTGQKLSEANNSSLSGEVYMYSSEYNASSAHPGMLILGFCALLAFAVLGVVTTRLTSLRKARERARQQEMEVSSVLELW